MKMVNLKQKKFFVGALTFVFALFFALGSLLMVTVGARAETPSIGDSGAETPSTSEVLTAPRTFNYTGAVQSITLAAGDYKLETWGAQGGAYNNNGGGGKGGSSSGNFRITLPTTLYIAVGSAGNNGSGGWNGGANATYVTSEIYATGGGGATHIATTNRGLLSSYNSYRNEVLIVAGGGGGSGYYSNTYYVGGSGGGANGSDAVGYYGSYVNAKGGTQSAGGAKGLPTSYTTDGYFGTGGSNSGTSGGWNGCGGGGGWHGGGGGGAVGGGGGGGSGYVNPSYLTGTTFNNGVQPGNGKVVITPLNAVPTQSNVVPNYNLARGASKTLYLDKNYMAKNNIALEANYGNHLNGTDADNGVAGKTEHIFLAVAGITDENGSKEFLTCSSGVNSADITFTVAKWWSGQKTFIVKVKDRSLSGSTYTDVAAGSIQDFKFTIDIVPDGGFAKQSKMLENQLNSGLTESEYKFGTSTTNMASSVSPVTNDAAFNDATTIFNPLHSSTTSRQTLMIKKPISTTGYININVGSLYLATTTADKVIYKGVEAGVGANAAPMRYSFVDGNSDPIQIKDYVYTTGETADNGYLNVPTIQNGYGNFRLKAKEGKVGGQYFYVITLTLSCYDIYNAPSGASKSATDIYVDVVFRIDNTRPRYAGNANSTITLPEPKAVNLMPSSGDNKPAVTQTINLTGTKPFTENTICEDPDGSTLKITGVKVPANEYVSLDKFGGILKHKSTSIYNYGVANSVGTVTSTVDFKGTNTLTKTAEQDGFATGFYPSLIGVVGDGNTNAFVSYTYTATSITFTGLKATRNMYANKGNMRANKGEDVTGHFYVMVRVSDSGDLADEGIWFPIAIRVLNRVPTKLTTPAEASGNLFKEDGITKNTFLFTPMSVTNASDAVTGLGSLTAVSSGLANGGLNIKPLAQDNDNFSMPNTVGKPFYNSKMAASNGIDASYLTYMQTDFTFLANDVDNKNIFDVNKVDPVLYGFKQFYTVKTVELFASAAAFAFYTDEQIGTFVNSGYIKLMRDTQEVSFNDFKTITTNPITHVKFLGLQVTFVRATQAQYIEIPINLIDTRTIIDDKNIGTADEVKKAGSTTISCKISNSGITKRTSTFNGIKRTDSNGIAKNVGEYSNTGEFYQYTLYVRDPVVSINAYDIFSDADGYNAINTNGVFNSNKENDSNKALVKAVNQLYTVKAGTDINNTVIKNDMTVDKLTIANTAPEYSATHGSVTYQEENKTAGLEQFESFQIKPTYYCSSVDRFLSFTFSVKDLEGAVSTVSVRLYVPNSLPTARDNNGNVFNRAYDVSAWGDAGNSSFTESSSSGQSFVDMDNKTYNIREFAIGDLLVDYDNNDLTWGPNSSVVVGTMVNNVFTPFTSTGTGDSKVDENVFVVAGLASGKGNRNNKTVLSVQGRSSTQGLPGGLFVSFQASDGVGAMVTFYLQIEVINQAPSFDSSVFEKVTTTVTDKTTTTTTTTTSYNWTSDSIVVNGKLKPYYVVPDNKSLDYTTKGTNITGNNTRVIGADLDYGQGISLNAFNYAQFKRKNLTSGLTLPSAGANLNENNVAVKYKGLDLIEGSVGFIFYYDDINTIPSSVSGKTIGSKIERSDFTADYDYFVACHETSAWAVVISPGKSMDNLEIEISMRDSSRPVYIGNVNVGNQGGNSLDSGISIGGYAGMSAYSGIRNFDAGVAKPNATISSSVNVKFTMNLKGLGLTNNFTAWADKENPERNNTWFATKKDDSTAKRHYIEDFDTTIDTADKRFVYNKIDVPRNKNTIYVPISYFAWPQNNKLGNGDALQDYFASFATEKFALSGLSSDDNQKAIFANITLEDGITPGGWSGATLNDNPYVTIGTSDTSVGADNFVGSAYLSGQRFAFGEDNGKLTFPTSNKYYEDSRGLSFTKKNLRSSGNLTLKVRLRPFKRTGSEGNYSYVPDVSGKRPDGADNTIDSSDTTVVVPLFVENGRINMKDGNYSASVSMANDGKSKTVNFDNGEVVNDATNIIFDQENDYHSATVKENIFTLANSFAPASLTAQQLNYMIDTSNTDSFKFRTNQAEILPETVARLKQYFGIADESELKNLFEVSLEGKIIKLKTEVAAKINPAYNNFFKVNPNMSDSRNITITPERMTTFDYSACVSRQKVIELALLKGLVATYNDSNSVPLTSEKLNANFEPNEDKTPTKIVYPFKVIVYDDFRGTGFGVSSYDVVTINVEIKNSSPEVKAGLGAKNVNGTLIKDYVSSINTSFRMELTEIFSDRDMTIENNIFLDETAVKNHSSVLTKDTSDYYTHKITFLPVKYDSLNKPITNEYLGEGKSGSIGAVFVKDSGSIIFTVHNRPSSFNPADYIAKIKVEFTDKYGKSTSVIFGFRIPNSAPTLSEQALAFGGGITINTGEQFNILATSYNNFKQGVLAGSTSSNSLASIHTNPSSSQCSHCSGDYNASIEKWDYTTLTDDSDKYNGGVFKEPTNGGKSYGFMPIAKDDTPWTLRIKSVTFGKNNFFGDGTLNSVDDYIYTTSLNKLVVEGGKDSSQGYYPTAYNFLARSSFTNVPVTVEIVDTAYVASSGKDSDEDITSTLKFTFNLTVKSTKPDVHSDDSGDGKYLGWSLNRDYPAFNGRLRTDKEITSPQIYALYANVGEEITLRTSDFAKDIDYKDDLKLYLLPAYGGGMFSVASGSNVFTNGILATNYIDIIPGSNFAVTDTNRTTQFTIKVKNFHNLAGKLNKYDEIRFYISDPMYTDTASAVPISLRIYTYPTAIDTHSDANVDGNTFKTYKTDVNSVADKNIEGKTTSVKIVTKTGGDPSIINTALTNGMLIDNDHSGSLSAYNVKVYTTFKGKNEAGNNEFFNVTDFTSSDSSKPGGSAEIKNKQLVVEYSSDITGPGIKNLFTTANSAFVKAYISDISFSNNGSVMKLVPSKGTNSLYGMFDSSKKGFQLYIEVSKYFDTSDAVAPPLNLPGFAKDYSVDNVVKKISKCVMDISVKNSAPTAVGNTNNNFNIAGKQYLNVSGAKGMVSRNFYLYNPYSIKDEALFTDIDSDSLTYKPYEFVGVSRRDNDTGDMVAYAPNSTVYDLVKGKPAESGKPNTAVKGAFTVSSNPESQFVDIDGNTHSLPSMSIKIDKKVVDESFVTPDGKIKDHTIIATINAIVNDGSVDAKTTITIEINNSNPTIKTAEQIPSAYKDMYKYNKNDGTGTLTLSIDKDLNPNGININVNDFIFDADWQDVNSEKYTFVAADGVVGIYLDGLSNIANGVLGVDGNTAYPSDENKPFVIKNVSGLNNSLIFKTTSYKRGESVTVTLIIEDSSGKRAQALYIKLVVANSAPVEIKDNLKRTYAGGKLGPDGGNFLSDKIWIYDTLTEDKKVVKGLVSDKNPESSVKLVDGNIKPSPAAHYLYFYNVVSEKPVFKEGSVFPEGGGGTGGGAAGGGAAGGDSSTPDNLVELIPFGQYLSVTPFANLFGTQRFTVTVSDGGNLNEPDSIMISFIIIIEVTKNPDEMVLPEFEVYHRRSNIMDNTTVFAGNEGDGIFVVDVKPVKATNAITIKKDEQTGAISVFGETVNAVVECIAQVKVGSQEKLYDMKINIKVKVNKPPEVVGRWALTEGTFFNRDELNEKTMSIDVPIDSRLTDKPDFGMFSDEAGDTLVLVSARSRKTAIVTVMPLPAVNSSDIAAVRFTFKSAGTAKVEVKVKDATGFETSAEFVVGSVGLNPPSFFVGMIAKVQENPTIFIIIGACVVLLLIILIAIIATAKKKKRMREEIEALLVSEMELEEQMLKLAASPSPTFYQSYGYLPPTQNVQQPGFMLGTGQDINSNSAIGLNPGAQNSGPRNPNTSNGFNDNDL